MGNINPREGWINRAEVPRLANLTTVDLDLRLFKALSVVPREGRDDRAEEEPRGSHPLRLSLLRIWRPLPERADVKYDVIHHFGVCGWCYQLGASTGVGLFGDPGPGLDCNRQNSVFLTPNGGDKCLWVDTFVNLHSGCMIAVDRCRTRLNEAIRRRNLALLTAFPLPHELLHLIAGFVYELETYTWPSSFEKDCAS